MVGLAGALRRRRARAGSSLGRGRDGGAAADRATFQTLHLASLASPALRGGLGPDAAAKAAGHLRALLGTHAVAITDTERLLAWDGVGQAQFGPVAMEHAGPVLRGAGTRVAHASAPKVPVRDVVVTPLITGSVVVGTFSAWSEGTSTGLVRAVDEVGRWMSGQLELAELDSSRARVAEAQVRALRAQISPHFIYNSLSAIASFVRTDPDRARELLLDFADFTRYSFRPTGDFTTLSDELRSIDRYMLLERARFGERLQFTFRVAPEVLGVSVPFLCLQPLVENAVRHGLEGKTETGHVLVVAEDAGSDCLLSVEDDGVGMTQDHLRAALSGRGEATGIGLGNVDERLRRLFGDFYGLTVVTAPGAGTTVSFRVPKFQPAVVKL
ncbi:MAG: sensor histidine kinase [Sporichthyaceae bacterium]